MKILLVDNERARPGICGRWLPQKLEPKIGLTAQVGRDVMSDLIGNVLKEPRHITVIRYKDMANY